MQFLSFLSNIPDVVWSGLLAATLTLIGVMLSNWSNTKRLLKQLSHDSREKGADRINSLRKEVYLKAVEELAKVNNYLGKIPNLDPSKENIGDGISEFYAAAAKLQLVAEETTAQLAGELVIRYGEIVLNLMTKASSIHDLNMNIKIAGEFYDRNQAQIARVVAEMTQLNESGNPNPVRFAALQNSFDNSQKAADHFAEERSDAFDARVHLMREYTIFLLKEIRSLGNLQVRLTAAIRNELNLKTDIVQYEKNLQENFNRMDKAIQELLLKLEE